MESSDVSFFSNIDPDVPITTVESLCMLCQEQGKTTLMCTNIPYFHEVILTSFHCDSCGYKNAGYQSGTMQDRGIRSTFELKEPEDISRKLVLSEYAAIKIPDLEFEVPPSSKQSVITTVEGVLRRVIEDLNLNQKERKEATPDVAEKIEEFLKKLENHIAVKLPFEIVIDDPSGNSCIEEMKYPDIDPQVLKEYYVRSREQIEELGLNINNTIEEEEVENIFQVTTQNDEEKDSNRKLDLTNEVQVFHTTCDQCQKPSITKMKLTTIPYFSDVVIMASECSHCGLRSNEVKSGGGINQKAKKITLQITDVSIDMSRDVLKSDTCSLKIPELDLCVGAGVLVAKFTTVEGLLKDIRDDLEKNPFLMGDSYEQDKRSKVDLLFSSIEKIITGELSASLVLDDPAGNSYLQNPKAPEADPHLTVEEYERTFDQNEELGLNDMKTENYTDS